jgi:DNA-binding response OmpR family regulator
MQSGGHIDVVSKLGQGTTFHLYFPSVAAPIVLDETLSPAEEHDLAGTETILVVEDEEPVRALIMQTLEKYGYTALEAANTEQALPLAMQYIDSIDLVLTDVVMPYGTGRELAEKLAAMRGEIPILYMSGYSDSAILQRGIRELNVNFIQKPFSPLELLYRIRALFAQKRIQSRKNM